MDAIALAAGFSKGACYFHFASKEDLFLELLRTYLAPGDGATPTEAAAGGIGDVFRS